MVVTDDNSLNRIRIHNYSDINKLTHKNKEGEGKTLFLNKIPTHDYIINDELGNHQWIVKVMGESSMRIKYSRNFQISPHKLHIIYKGEMVISGRETWEIQPEQCD